MHTVSVMLDGAGGLRVLLHSTDLAVAGPLTAAEEGEAGEEALEEGPSPIAPEAKELLWGGGSFLVLLLAMRLVLVPKVKEGMQSRYGKIRTDLEGAEATRDAANAEAAQYESQLAGVRAEAAGRIDTARQQLDGERSDRLAEANSAIAERRSAAAAEAETAHAAAAGSIEDAAVAVAARVVELTTGRRPDEATVRGALADATSAGVSR